MIKFIRWYLNFIQPGFLGSVLGAVAGPIIGGIFGSNASNNASQAQQQGVQQANALQQQIYGDTSNNLAPYRQTGGIALKDLQYLAGIGPNESSGDMLTNSGIFPGALGGGNSYGGLFKPFSMSDFQESPAYQFNLQRGQDAINKAAASRGNFYAPQTLQDLSKFSQGIASNEFTNAYNMYNNDRNSLYSKLSGMAGAGQNAAVNQGGFGQNYGANVGNNLIGAGNAAAAGQVGGANAISGGISGAYNNYLVGQILSGNQGGSYGGYNNSGYGGGYGVGGVQGAQDYYNNGGSVP